jgi:glycosyltransferase involved in cell wall biosynthesis
MAYTSGAQRLEKVLIVNTADAGGGAERQAMALLDGLPKLGVETHLVVGATHTDHDRVISMYASPHVDYRPYQPRLRRKLTRARWLLDRRLGREDFAHPLTRHILEMAGPPPDLMLCENLHGGYFDLRMLPWLSRRTPVVLALNDSWLFTGHCACPLACGRWQAGCGRCPELEIPPAVRRDRTAANWRLKRDIMARSRVWALAPSDWMLERAGRSLLGAGLQGGRVVAHGVDLETFSPGSRSAARRSLCLDPQAKILLYVANLGAGNPTKDFVTVRRALMRLSRAKPRTDPAMQAPTMLLVVGAQQPDEQLGENVSIRHLPHCESRPGLAELYRACDLYVHSAREESFSLTTAEALACGIPAVIAAGGGVREVVEHERSGLLLEPGDDAALAAALLGLLEDRERREGLGAGAADSARTHFDVERTVAETLAWCEQVACEWARADRR